jgi:hypothetical protein
VLMSKGRSRTVRVSQIRTGGAGYVHLMHITDDRYRLQVTEVSYPNTPSRPVKAERYLAVAPGGWAKEAPAPSS